MEGLLRSSGLREVEDAGYTVGVFEGERLLGCGSLRNDTIMGVAVDDRHKGEGISAKVITHLIKVALARGLDTVYLFTRPEKAAYFTSMGFRLVVKAPPHAAMLEWGADALSAFKRRLAGQAFDGLPEAAAIVMNANPFTMGHRYLVERAALEHDHVYVILVEEEHSLFPFAVRQELVQKGVMNLPNVRVLSGGRYVVSALTFPSYFTQEQHLAEAHASMDLTLFASQIAPSLNIKTRYVGTEPNSVVTNIYNEVMKALLPREGIQVMEIPRIRAGNGPVSASRVRRLLAHPDWAELRSLVPPFTYAYIVDHYDDLKQRLKNFPQGRNLK